MGFVSSIKGVALIFLIAGEIANASVLRRNNRKPTKKTRQLKRGRVALVTRSDASFEGTPSPTKGPTKGPTGKPSTSSPHPTSYTIGPVSSSPSPTPAYDSKATGIPSTPSPSLTCYKKTRKVEIAGDFNDMSPINMFEFQAFSDGENVALNGDAWQSTTLNWDDDRFGALNAIDGDNSTFSHTIPDRYYPYWSLAFDQSYQVDKIVILNRWCGDESDPSGCLCRLSGLHVRLWQGNDYIPYILGDTCGQKVIEISLDSDPDCDTFSPTANPTPWPSYSPTSSMEPTISSRPTYMNCYGRAKQFLIQSKSGKPLQMFEVQAITSSGVNVAIGQDTWQSSTLKDNDAKFGSSLAVDNDISTFAHTKEVEEDPEWSVSFDQPQDIETVTILNRYCESPDDPLGCLCRLTGAWLWHINEDGHWSLKELGDTCDQTVISIPFISSPYCPTPTPAPTISLFPSITTSPTITSSPTITCYKVKWIEIYTSTGEPIQMFELQAIASDGENLALGAHTWQSSTFKDNEAKFGSSMAVDGDNSTFSHTKPDAYSSLWIELKDGFALDRIVIMNRWCTEPGDDCLCRLSNATMLLIDERESLVASRRLGDTCGSSVITETFTSNPDCDTEPPSMSPTSPPPTTSNTPTMSPTITCYPKVRKVRLYNSKSAKPPINMFEFQVYADDGTNVALGGTVAQSSTLKNDDERFGASKAVDGDNSTFSHTNPENYTHSWEVDLNGNFALNRVTILNRWCVNPSDPNQCLCRLSGFKVGIYDSNYDLVTIKYLEDTCDKQVLDLSFASNPDCPTEPPSKSPTLEPSSSMSPSTTPSPTMTCHYVKAITLSTGGERPPIQIWELQAWSRGVNVALDGIASQSTTYSSASAWLAIDDWNYTYSRTANDGMAAEWRLDLDGLHFIDQINILLDPYENRTDWSCSFTDVKLRLIGEDGSLIAEKYYEGDKCMDESTKMITEAFTSNPACPTSPPTMRPTSSPTFSNMPSMAPTITCYPKVRKLRVSQKSKSSKIPLNMFEFRAFTEDGTNVALDGTATQDSTLKGDDERFGANNAIDNINSTFSHTDPEDDYHSWEVDLNGHFAIDRVTILNRWCVDPSDPNDCLCRLSSFNVHLYTYYGSSYNWVTYEPLADTCGQQVLDLSFASNPDCPTHPPTSMPTLEVFCNQHASAVLLTTYTESPIHMFEFEAYSSGSNVIAAGGSVYQSSTLKDNPKYAPEKAIDGDNSTFSHTSDSDYEWWRVDFVSRFELTSVRILNRFCGDLSDEQECMCRLSYATLSLLGESGVAFHTRQLGDTCGQAVIVEEFVSSPSCPSSAPSVAPSDGV